MSGEKRGTLEVAMDVLLSLEKQNRQTRIQYVANIDHTKVRAILGNLMVRGFVKKETIRTRTLYHLTETGRELIHHIKMVKTQLDGVWNPFTKKN